MHLVQPDHRKAFTDERMKAIPDYDFT